MIPRARLEISRFRRFGHLIEGARSVNEVRGGPIQLLEWVETQLGLNGPPIQFSERVVDYARRLRAANGATYRESLRRDLWATATELLRRRDDLWEAGWDGKASTEYPVTVNDLAKAESAPGPFRPGTQDRIRVALETLDKGLRLPAHEITLWEPAAAWPRLWRRLIERLNVKALEEPHSNARAGSALADLFRSLDSGHRIGSVDDTLNGFQAQSRHTAVHALASWLKHGAQDARKVVILANDAATITMLDAALTEAGLPAAGVAIQNRAQPALQVLPLVLQLCWEPVDPHKLLDFLLLPTSPIPRSAAFRLSEALSRQPGLGSDAWNAAWADATSAHADPDGKVKERLAAWLKHERVPIGAPLPYALVEARCKLVAQWARGRAEQLADAKDETGLAESYRVASAQAKAFGELAATLGVQVPENQVFRILEDVLSEAATTVPRPAQSGGPVWVDDFSEIPPGTETVVLLNVAAPNTPRPRWTPAEARQLEAAGLAGPSAQDNARWQRKANLRGLAGAARCFILFAGQDEETPKHPLWIEFQSRLPETFDLPSLEDAVDTASWPHPTEAVTSVASPPVRATWNVPRAAIRIPETHSASSLEAMLGCPAKWLFQYSLKVRAAPLTGIPDTRTLKGNLGHHLMEILFRPGEAIPEPDACVAKLEQVFDEMVGSNAAPLAQPRKAREKQALLREMRRSVHAFVECLRAGAYRVEGLEQDVEATVDGLPVQGRIDCVIANDEGQAIIDFKYGGHDRYAALLETGKALQLAAYAATRQDETKVPVHGAGYLILSESVVVSPTGSPVAGAGNVDGPSIHDTWTRFRAAIRNADQWLLGEAPVPAFPLLPPGDWPPGTDLAFDGDPRDPAPCRYCDYGVLCGRRRIP